jgi:biopolymer transport protein ExbD
VNLRPRRRESPDVNLTPLIDVVFLLLIFFMVSTTFDREAELSIELPTASGKPAATKEAPIDVSIDLQGRYFVNGKPLVNTQLPTLKRALEIAAGGKTPAIVINADANTSHKSVVQVMDAASQLGLSRLRFAARAGDN